MAAKAGITPRHLAPIVKEILVKHRGEWMSPADLWDEIKQVDTEVADRVQEKIRTYQDQTRNNAVWFVSNTLSYLDKQEGFSISNVDEVPEMRGKTFWLIARSE